MTPPPELRALAANVLDNDMSEWTCLKDNANSTVWQTGALVIKHHRHPRAFAQELWAYREWLPRLELACAPRIVGAPRLLAVDPAARALALTRRPGHHLAPGTSSMHTAGGRFARALHELAVADDDPVPLADAIGARLDSWHARADGLLTPAERDALARLAAARDAFVGVARVPCHRDFTPDNWLTDRNALHILDFEHARLDAPEADLVKLRAEVWPDAPHLEAAFLAGYGPLDSDARARLDVLLALHAVATLAWAHRHHDPIFAARGRQALAAALQADVS